MREEGQGQRETKRESFTGSTPSSEPIVELDLSNLRS